ncbi:DUF4232 domain-containing protein [Cellulomonas marina]|uniref:DUF4232 domain-containing protein n=1 Tax=Cellulomonas marina TaxID=988821 RepID=UPI000B7F2C9D|nr:DUF4232 domain-containing protein [Cellulomonas marina]GIG30288.1 hypothetical protein Cma02nite_28880 [Cellulomonas marina]
MTATAAAVAGLLLLAGCTGGDDVASPTAGATGAGTGAATSTPSPPASSPSAAPSATTPPPTPLPTPTGDTGGEPAAGDRCTSAVLTGSLGAGGGGAAGSVTPDVVLTNTGTVPCTLQGWPGVSLVGGGDGTQIGAPAVLDRTSEHPTVTLAPGGTALAALRIARADDYDAAACDPQPADGLRVYPPGDTASLFVEAEGLTGCAAGDVTLLEVQALRPAR